MGKDWQEVVDRERQQTYFEEMQARLATLRQSGVAVYPADDQVLAALTLTPLQQVQVVILGQDPYHGPGQAHGLSFSVPDGVKVPPSLRNIFKELHRDVDDFAIPSQGNLSDWARQGVLLLNTVLTVEQGRAHSHARLGWERFTDALLAELNQGPRPVVFMLWGAHAQKKGRALDSDKHLILKAPHPSPLSAHRGFLGCGHFSKANEWLMQQGRKPICWQL
ncbi:MULTISPECIES: uracil-DNA glycosylase [Ferrimonas]|uniref:uracil-DNA glycosylase n=1 Tax=Ferrimonas TaxID=44011 RepID=UPI0005550F46|nr:MULTISPECIES: uracil-DNA glycosylase [Ferrimonas]USD38199.1 uracil-DNA glycosylase [Ferrimonas sp. SCSIO 43195]